MPKLKVGDTFKKVYPFWLFESDGCLMSGPVECWNIGCKKSKEGGGQYFPPEIFFNADAEGFIIYEVLAVTEMPRKYETRVIYTLSFIDPDGKCRNQNKAHIATMTKFNSWINAAHSPYWTDYEVEV